MSEVRYVWRAEWQKPGDGQVLLGGERTAVTDRDVPEDKRCLVPGECIGYEPGEPCCESGGFGVGFVTGSVMDVITE